MHFGFVFILLFDYINTYLYSAENQVVHCSDNEGMSLDIESILKAYVYIFFSIKKLHV